MGSIEAIRMLTSVSGGKHCKDIEPQEGQLGRKNKYDQNTFRFLL